MKKKPIETVAESSTPTIPVGEVATYVPPKQRINPLTQEFGNGDMNTLRDKLNEIIEIIG